jgi:beta-lactam-binding protein with PASTA domain
VKVALALLLLAAGAPALAQPSPATAAAQVRYARVPPVEQLRLSAARGILADSGFVIEVTYRDARPAERDVVLDQVPDAGTRARIRSTVSIVVGRVPFSRGQMVSEAVTPPVAPTETPTVTQPPRLADVPVLKGLDSMQAIRALETNRLGFGRASYAPSDEERKGLISHQDPGPGTRVRMGTRIDVTFSTGPHVVVDSGQRMPRLTDLAPATAAETLKVLGLRLDHMDSTAVAGSVRRVTSQSPDEGTVVHAGDVVWFGYEYPLTIPEALGVVPHLVDSTVTVSLELIAAAGFATSRIVGPNVPGAVVDSQSPGAGESVSLQVPITLFTRVNPVRMVPALIDSLVAVAIVRAENAEFGTAVIGRRWTMAFESRVVAQDPAAGAAPPGATTISITVGRPVGPVAAVAGTLLAVLGLVFFFKDPPPPPPDPDPRRRPEDDDDVPAPDIRVDWSSSQLTDGRVEAGEQGTAYQAWIEVRFGAVVESPVITCEANSVFKAWSVDDGG